MTPDELRRERLARAERAPADEASRGDLLWLVRRGNSYDGEYERAVERLVTHHAGHVDVARMCLIHGDHFSKADEELRLGVLAAAELREARGFVRLGLARYFQMLEPNVAARRLGRTHRWASAVSPRPVDGETLTLAQRDSTDPHSNSHDPADLRDRAESLLREVIAEYADIPYRHPNFVEQEEILAMPQPMQYGRILSEDEIERIRVFLAHERTLGEVAAEYLDELTRLRVGQPAPAIDRPDLNGSPLRLSDYLGRVVLLSFWSSDVPACLDAAPAYRDLSRRYHGRPFALLGVNTRDIDDDGRDAAIRHGMDWPHWGDEDAAIMLRYHLHRWPVQFLIDHRGLLVGQFTGLDEFDDLVESLVLQAP